MEKIAKALDAIIEAVNGGAEADAIIADLEELKKLVGEAGEGDAEEKSKDDPIRKAMGLQSKE